jgi:two-component system, cell cycle sensor histidine kinase and response regulator CckA
MTYFTVSAAYTAMNLLLATIVFFKSRRNQITRYYYFCVFCLIVFGTGSFIISLPIDADLKSILRHTILFVYAIYPFLFIHFTTYFLRRKEIVQSLTTSAAIYSVGLFSYAMILLDYIPKPMTETGAITQTGYIFYLTWMSIFFSIGIAMLFEVSRQFRRSVKNANVIFVGSAFLLLILPGPFMDSLFFGVFHFTPESYYYLCTLALVIAIYFIFRHKIILNTMYDALKSALAVMNDIFIKTDENFQIELIKGKAVSNLLGYTEDELIGRPFGQMIREHDYLNEYRSFVLSKKMNESYFDAEMLCKNGTTVPMNFSFTPMFDEEELTGFVSVGRDMTEWRKLEDQLRQSQKMESLGTLAGGIAHDFNNLLQIMLLSISNLKRKPVDETKITKVIEISTTTIDRGKKLIQQILTFARKSDVQFESVNINTAIEDVIKLLSETFPRSITLNTSFEASLPEVMADPNQLHQVMINLCVNARDAVVQNGSILLKTELVNGWDVKKSFPDAQEERYVCISVTDTGCGMNEKIRGRIFEPFYTTKEQGKGTGLGLAVVYGIVTAHKGFIDVQTTVGVGTTFLLYLPVPRISDHHDKKVISGLTELHSGSGTILLVEDEKIISQAISTLLESYGYRVIAAFDGYEAIEAFERQRDTISLVVMDIGLPKLNGWEAYEKIKSIKSDVKVIMASGYLDPKAKSERRINGSEEFIKKPYNPEELLIAIDRMLRRSERLEDAQTISVANGRVIKNN